MAHQMLSCLVYGYEGGQVKKKLQQPFLHLPDHK